MIKKHYTGNARRALNIVWNAAASYDFEPPFLAYYPNGRPDPYFNMVIGFVKKYFDLERIDKFFESYSRAGKAEEYDEFLWLGIESCVYKMEMAERPVLAELRQTRAEEFFRVMQTLSRPQMEYSSMPVFTQQQARWSEVLGKRLPVMTTKEKKLYEALKFPACPDTEGLILCMKQVLTDCFHYDPDRKAPAANPSRGLRALAGRIFRHQKQQRDVLFLRTGSGTGDRERSVELEHFASGRRVRLPDQADRDYIRACFGEPALSQAEMRILENDLCKGAHAYTRLYVARGTVLVAENGDPADAAGGAAGGTVLLAEDSEKSAAGTVPLADEKSATGTVPLAEREERVSRASSDQIPRTAQELAAKRRQQAERNRAYLSRNARLVQGQIRHLSAKLNTVFESYLRFLPEESSSGSLIAGKAWRMKLLNDSHVFEKSGNEAEKDIAVTLLLDASMSRVNSQEVIAAEAYVIQESFRRAGIPVQVAAFRSLRGYTVLEVLKDFDEKRASAVMNFYSGGWNRDGLALSLVGTLIRDRKEYRDKKQLLFVLTDGSPNDSAPMPPVDAHGKTMDRVGLIGPVSREYQGPEAVADTKRAAAALRDEGIRTAAIFHGATYHLENIRRIYGEEYVRIRKLDQLSEAVTELLLRQLRRVDAR